MKPTGSTLAVIGLLSLVAVSLAKADEPSAVYQSLLAKYDVNKGGLMSPSARSSAPTGSNLILGGGRRDAGFVIPIRLLLDLTRTGTMN